MAIIARTALDPVIFIPISLFRARILSVTAAIDKPKERASLSTRFICLPLKNTSVQAKPGKRNTSMKPRTPLMAGMLSRKGTADPMTSLIPASQSTPYASSLSIPSLDVI